MTLQNGEVLELKGGAIALAADRKSCMNDLDSETEFNNQNDKSGSNKSD